jgi:uncharacterized protein YegJ (DUF2314 family)
MNSVSGQTGKTERPGEPDIYSFKSSDKEMNEAIKTAKLTLKEFNTALLSRNKNFRSFALKVRFPTSKGSEHIWLSSISFKQNKYSGIVDDVPEAIPNMKMGDTIQIPIDNISDWLYLDKNKLRGGYTIRVIRNHLTEPERKKFDSENNFVIED